MTKKLAKYEVVKKDIIEKIEKNSLGPNEMIPSENDLKENYQVSRVTIRRAIDELIKEGYIYKKRGVGSFVRDRARSQGISRIHSFTEAVNFQGRTPSKKVISLDLDQARDEDLIDLDLDPGDQVYRLRTNYYSDGRPYCYNETNLSEKLFKNLEYFDLENRSLYQILKEFYHIEISRSVEFIKAVRPEDYIYDILEVDRGQPLLELNAITYCIYDNRELAFERYRAYMVTDLMSYYVEKYN